MDRTRQILVSAALVALVLVVVAGAVIAGRSASPVQHDAPPQERPLDPGSPEGQAERRKALDERKAPGAR